MFSSLFLRPPIILSCLLSSFLFLPNRVDIFSSSDVCVISSFNHLLQNKVLSLLMFWKKNEVQADSYNIPIDGKVALKLYTDASILVFIHWKDKIILINCRCQIFIQKKIYKFIHKRHTRIPDVYQCSFWWKWTFTSYRNLWKYLDARN